MEQLYDAFVSEVDTTIANLKPGTLAWYRSKALAFQYGGTLLPDSDVYDNTGLSDTDIAAQKIIAQAACVLEDGAIKLKVVKANGYPLINDELNQFEAYIAQNVQYAGDDVVFVSSKADFIRATLDIYYDASILSTTGLLTDGSEPARLAAYGYLSSLGFNGLYKVSSHQDAILAAKGVTDARLYNVQATGYDVVAWQDVVMQYQPIAGVMSFGADTNLTINYIPQL
jgi:hypothetical protein